MEYQTILEKEKPNHTENGECTSSCRRVGCPPCEICDGEGKFTVDTMTNGEHDQYEQVCECRINDEPADMSGAE